MTTGPAPYYQDGSVHLFHGDCLEVLPELPADSVDAVCTDPPYGLEFMGKEWDRPWAVGMSEPGYGDAERMARPSFGDNRNANCRTCGGRQRGARRCICAEPVWDRHPREDMLAFGAWCHQWAAECLRILKPGGFLLAFGGTRTSHRLACAIEDAGFEIRDSIAWLYSQGFPKSLDVSKAIDRAAGVERTEVVGTRLGRPGMASDGSNQDFGNWRQVEGRTDRPDPALDITAPATPEAEQWQGWGTALKPAHEPIIVARKPLGAGTVAANVLRWGTGALNIDAGRIATDDDRARPPRTPNAIYDNGKGASLTASESHPAGRWPANVALDESQADALDQMSGETISKPHQGGTAKPGAVMNREDGGIYDAGRRFPSTSLDDRGGASRFFYTSKASSDERITHNEPMCVCGHSRSQHTDDEWGSCLIPGCWCPGFAIDRSTVKRTAHPTVKPLSLMRWLVRLVTPPGGLILEPFAGSGTTVEAALLEGFRCIAIEREADYLPLITQRINRRRDPIAYIKAAGEDLGLFGDDDNEPEAPSQSQGRWPANVVLDRSQAAALDQMSGETRGTGGNSSGSTAFGQGSGWNPHENRATEIERINDSGGASRFFKVVDDDLGDGVA